MKLEVKCYKCGKRIFVHDYSTTDICPECMSFIDVAEAKAALEEEKKAALSIEKTETEISELEPNAAEETAAAAEPEIEIEPATEIKTEPEPERKTQPEQSAEEELSWRASWQNVLQKTKGLTDLSKFEYVRVDAREAFKKMSAAERAQLYKTYGKTLAARRKTLEDRIRAADAEVTYIESSAENKKKNGKWLWFFIPIVVVFFIVFAILADTSSMENAATGIIFFFVVTIFIVIASVGIAYDTKKRKNAGNSSFAAGTGEEQSYHYLSALERADIRKEIDNIDWLCGFLKF